ncbi:DUF523 domain-containing protein [Puteibacter caeruleilacunae]|nr:DUF523 domain-containing protein [Puteibacter caeruleilacunae]
MPQIIVSACLAGIKCRYDGNANLIEEIRELVESGKAIPLCPEVMGGLPTPRKSCEIIKEDNELKIVNTEGEDCTKVFQEGAQKTAAIAKIVGAEYAILKQRSPSCGYGKIYDGTFSGKIIPGKGFTATLLEEQGVKIFTEENFEEINK